MAGVPSVSPTNISGRRLMMVQQQKQVEFQSWQQEADVAAAGHAMWLRKNQPFRPLSKSTLRADTPEFRPATSSHTVSEQGNVWQNGKNSINSTNPDSGYASQASSDGNQGNRSEILTRENSQSESINPTEPVLGHRNEDVDHIEGPFKSFFSGPPLPTTKTTTTRTSGNSYDTPVKVSRNLLTIIPEMVSV